MAFVACTHLDGVGLCTDSPKPGAGDPAVCICRNSARTAAWPRIRNVHTGSHARLVKRTTTPPTGVEAEYDFEHDTPGTQTGGAVNGDPVAYTDGQLVTF